MKGATAVAGRIIVALVRVLLAVGKREEDLSEITAHIEKTIKLARARRDLERRFAIAKNQPRGNPELLAIDAKVDRAVDTLVKANKAYAKALAQRTPVGVDFSEVRAAREKCQEMLMGVVAMIAGRFPLPTPSHDEARQALLGPIVEQNEAIREYLRSRRAVPDVDPDTGETEPAIDTPPPALQPPTNGNGEAVVPTSESDDLQPSFD